MKYNSNNILKNWAHFSKYLKIKAKKDEKAAFALTNVYAIFPSNFFRILSLIRDLAASMKSCANLIAIGLFWFLPQKGHKKIICNRAFSYKKEIL